MIKIILFPCALALSVFLFLTFSWYMDLGGHHSIQGFTMSRQLMLLNICESTIQEHQKGNYVQDCQEKWRQELDPESYPHLINQCSIEEKAFYIPQSGTTETCLILRNQQYQNPKDALLCSYLCSNRATPEALSECYPAQEGGRGLFGLDGYAGEWSTFMRQIRAMSW